MAINSLKKAIEEAHAAYAAVLEDLRKRKEQATADLASVKNEARQAKEDFLKSMEELDKIKQELEDLSD